MRNLLGTWQFLLILLWWSLWLTGCSPISNTQEMATAHVAPATPIPTTVQAAGTPTATSTPADSATAPIRETSQPPTGAPPTAEQTGSTPAVCPPPIDEDLILAPAAKGQTIVEMFEPPLLAYLNAGGDARTLQVSLDRLTLDDDGQTWAAASRVHHTDVTGDAASEVIVDLLFYVEGQFADGGLFVFRCQDGQYVGGTVTRIGAQLFAGQGPEPIVQTIQDMNGNGRPDILLSYVTVIGTHANFTREFRILEWDGSQFMDLIQSDGHRPHSAEVHNGKGIVCGSEGDATLELKLIHGPDADGAGCTHVDVWSWTGEAFVLTRTEPCPPGSPPATTA